MDTTFAKLVSKGCLAADWAKALTPISAQIDETLIFLQQEKTAGRQYSPTESNIFKAFSYPLQNVKILIVGQDPYPQPNYPNGLAFSVDRTIKKLPASLKNIYLELENDLGIEAPNHGDLSAWCQAGVMLLNRTLTVNPKKPGSHFQKGWEAITSYAIKTLVAKKKPFVTILWGKKAQTLQPLLANNPTIVSAHPSPLSAYKGFFGSKPFSKANSFLLELGQTAVDWKCIL